MGKKKVEEEAKRRIERKKEKVNLCSQSGI
jgi:hypothetical protein